MEGVNESQSLLERNNNDESYQGLDFKQQKQQQKEEGEEEEEEKQPKRRQSEKSSLSTYYDISTNVDNLVLEYRIYAVLATKFTFLFFTVFALVLCLIAAGLEFGIYYGEDEVDTIYLTIDSLVTSFLNGFLLVLFTSPIVVYGAKRGMISFMETSVLDQFPFKYMPLKIKSILLRSIAMGLFACVVYGGVVALMYWILCVSEDKFCSIDTMKIAIFSGIWVFFTSVTLLPFVFIAALNRMHVSDKVILDSMQAIKMRNQRKKTPRNRVTNNI